MLYKHINFYTIEYHTQVRVLVKLKYEFSNNMENYPCDDDDDQEKKKENMLVFISPVY